MKLEVTVTQQDVDTGVRQSLFECAVVQAVRRSFPDLFVSMVWIKVHNATGAPVMEVQADGTEKQAVLAKVSVFKHMPPSWREFVNENSLGHFDTSKIPEKGTEARKIWSTRCRKEIEELRQLVGELPPEAVRWIRKFDNQKITPEDVPFVFNLELNSTNNK